MIFNKINHSNMLIKLIYKCRLNNELKSIIIINYNNMMTNKANFTILYFIGLNI